MYLKRTFISPECRPDISGSSFQFKESSEKYENKMDARNDLLQILNQSKSLSNLEVIKLL